ncbi:MAG: hypothetical protein JSW47_13050 [Phycisphaerales bacterium]|nr:MAG: hypothetical protein JSW47_13050 [Phycisphaerales bacterium]
MKKLVLILLLPFAGCVAVRTQHPAGNQRATTDVDVAKRPSTFKTLGEFNVLKHAIVDIKWDEVYLLGTLDENYNTGPVPYTSFLRTTLAYPDPSFSLEWTSKSKTDVDRFFAKWSEDVERFEKDPDFADQYTLRVLKPMMRDPNWRGWQGISQKVAATLEVEEAEVRDFWSKLLRGRFSTPPDSTVLNILIKLLEKSGARKFAVVLEATVRTCQVQDATEGMSEEEANSIWYEQAILPFLERSGLQDNPELERLAFLLQEGRISDREFVMQMGELFEQFAVEAFEEIGLNAEDGRLFVRYFLLRKSVRSDDFDRMRQNFERRLPKVLTQKFAVVLKKAMGTTGEMRFSPEILQSYYGVSPQMSPGFIQLDRTSQLARVMFEADSTLKLITADEKEASKVEGHLPVNEWELTHLTYRQWQELPRRSSVRFWFVPRRISLGESADGSIIAFGDTQIGLEARVKGPRRAERKDPLLQRYADEMTARYDEFAQVFPELHELREAAKIQTLAKLLKARGFRGRAKETAREWQPPKTIPGLLTAGIFWGSKYLPGRSKYRLILDASGEGGVDFRRLEKRISIQKDPTLVEQVQRKFESGSLAPTVHPGFFVCRRSYDLAVSERERLYKLQKMLENELEKVRAGRVNVLKYQEEFEVIRADAARGALSDLLTVIPVTEVLEKMSKTQKYKNLVTPDVLHNAEVAYEGLKTLVSQHYALSARDDPEFLKSNLESLSSARKALIALPFSKLPNNDEVKLLKGADKAMDVYSKTILFILEQEDRKGGAASLSETVGSWAELGAELAAVFSPHVRVGSALERLAERPIKLKIINEAQVSLSNALSKNYEADMYLQQKQKRIEDFNIELNRLIEAYCSLHPEVCNKRKN